MNRSVVIIAGFIAALVAIGSACGGTDCSQVVKFKDVKAFSRSCVECHSSKLEGADRNSAPSDINFDTFEGAK
jgi:hypothetical protein